MLKTILCATDFSERFRFTIDWGVWLSRWFSARLLVFHAVPTSEDSLFASDSAIAGRDADGDIAQSRRRLESLMAGHPVDWEPLVARGDSVESLLPLAVSRNIDLVVAASYGLSGIKRVLLGTVVERMARSLNCPLWVVRTGIGSPAPTGIRRIAVSCDFTRSAYRVMETAAAMAEAFGAELRLVHAVEAPLDEDVVEPTAGPYEKIQQELQNRLREKLERRFAAVADPRVPAEAVVVPGHPGEQIPAFARQWGADLVGVGVRPHGRIEKFLRGSTTEALLRKAPCAVLAIPTAAGEPKSGTGPSESPP